MRVRAGTQSGGWSAAGLSRLASVARRHARLKNAAAENRSTLEPVVSAEKVGRNDPCPCGSGAKAKRCCL